MTDLFTTNRTTISVKSISRFPSLVTADTGVGVTKANGNFNFTLDYNSLAQETTIADKHDWVVAALNESTGIYKQLQLEDIPIRMHADTVSQFEATDFNPDTHVVDILGYYTVGAGAFRVRRVSSEPAHAWKFRSLDRHLPDETQDQTNGGWWEGYATDGVIQPEMLGAKGDGTTDDTTAIQNTLNLLTGGTAGGVENPTIILASPSYKVTATLAPPNSASYFTLAGYGGRNSILYWSGSAGGTVLKLTNARGVVLRNFGIFASGATPGYAIQIHRAAGLVGGAAPMQCVVDQVVVSTATVGVGYTCNNGYDANNEQGLINKCEFYTCSTAGVAFEHSNSLWHTVSNCYFSSCGAAITNIPTGSTTYASTGGGFTASYCGSTTNAIAYHVQTSLKPIIINGCQSEADEVFVETDTTAGNITIVSDNCSFSGGTVSNIVINCKATPVVYADIRNFSTFTPLGSILTFSNASSKVNISSTVRTQLATLNYNCFVSLDVAYNATGLALNNLGSGSIYDVTASKTGDTAVVVGSLSSGALPAILPSTRMIIIQSGGAGTATSLSGGVSGQTLTIYNADYPTNLTLDHTVFVLKGNVDAVVTNSRTITLIKTTAPYGSLWVEVARNF